MLQLFAAGSELFVVLKPMTSDGILQEVDRC
jgi:hypothetical protein